MVSDEAPRIVTGEGLVEEDLLIGRVHSVRLPDRSGRIARSGVHDAPARLHYKKAVRSGAVRYLPGRGVPVARAPGPESDRERAARVPPAEHRIVLPGVPPESPGPRREELAGRTARFFGWLPTPGRTSGPYSTGSARTARREHGRGGTSGSVSSEEAAGTR